MPPTASNPDSAIIELIQPNLDTGPWIAGGACLQWLAGRYVNTGVHDIDIFFKDQEQFDKFRETLTKKRHGVFHLSKTDKVEFHISEIFNTKNAVTYKVMHAENGNMWTLQLIKQFSNTLEDMLNRFDFRCCKIATDGTNWLAAPGAVEDARRRKITVDRIVPENIYKRAVKYYTYGYEFEPGFIQDLINDPSFNKNFTHETEYDI